MQILQIFLDHTAAAIDQVATQLAKEKELKYDVARSMVYSNGYKIYTTQDSSIQDIMEEEYLKTKYIKKARTKKEKQIMSIHNPQWL